MKHYAFIDAASKVVQLIVGNLSEEQQQRFLDEYEVMFSAVAIIEIPTDVPVWIGGSYDSDNGFLPPVAEPQPEPLPEVVTETEI